MDEIWRVLKDDGTVWVNLGDSYNGNKSGNTQGTYKDKVDPSKSYANNSTLNKRKQSAPEKCLLLIPHRFAIGCIEKNWVLRNDIIWAKRNGMPEPVTDRFSKKHEYFFFMTKQKKYYFDLDGIKTPYTKPMNRWGGNNLKADGASMWDKGAGQKSYRNRNMRPDENGKNPGSVSDFWDIPTKPSKTKHYATFNTDLIDKPIIAGCPKGGIILDPFAGTGTTLVRALQLGRKVIGIDGSKEYCKIAEERIEDELVYKFAI